MVVVAVVVIVVVVVVVVVVIILIVVLVLVLVVIVLVVTASLSIYPVNPSSIDSVVIGSGMIGKRDLLALSEVCSAFHASVRARVKHLSGRPELLANLEKFPGARSLTVTFNIQAGSDATPSSPSWYMPGCVSVADINLESINDLTIQVYDPSENPSRVSIRRHNYIYMSAFNLLALCDSYRSVIDEMAVVTTHFDLSYRAFPRVYVHSHCTT